MIDNTLKKIDDDSFLRIDLINDPNRAIGSSSDETVMKEVNATLSRCKCEFLFRDVLFSDAYALYEDANANFCFVMQMLFMKMQMWNANTFYKDANANFCFAMLYFVMHMNAKFVS